MCIFNCSNKLAVFILLIVLAGLSFTLFGFNNAPPVSDAKDYYMYAQNIALGKGYSLDGKTFSIWREPIYPIFLSLFYQVFGIDKTLDIKIAQVILIAAAAFFVFLIFEMFGSKCIGVIASAISAFMPLYGPYANLFLPEALTIFLLISSSFIVLKILNNSRSRVCYLLLGVEFGLMSLMRSHLILFIAVIAAVFIFTHKPLRHTLIFLLTSIIIVGLWMGYVYSHTGKFEITSGRQELHIYTRSVRATLSYREEFHYLTAWLKRSYSAGAEDDVILNKYDAVPLVRYYYTVLLKQGNSAASIERENIGTILHNPGHYLFGNIVEWVKLMSVEHFFPPVSPLLTRPVRALTYIFIYLLFLAGIAGFLMSKNRQYRPLIYITGLYILYHWFILSFFDVIPRFNTPYLSFYLIIGVAGLISFFQNEKGKIYKP